MIPFKLTALTQATPLIKRKAKTRIIFPRKTFQNFTLESFIFSSFNLISRFSSVIFSPTTPLQYFRKEATAELNSQFILDEDQEMERQPIYLSSDESEIASPCSSPNRRLPNNVPDTYSAITQLLAAQHEHMASSGNFALQHPPTPPPSLISDDDNDEVFTLIMGNPAHLLPYTPNRRPQALQLSQQITPIPDTPESPTPENSAQSDIFRKYDLPENLSDSTSYDNHPVFRQWQIGCKI